MKANPAACVFRRFAALVCLLSFCLGQSNVVPLGFAAFASVEGSHTVKFNPGDDSVRVVLSHELGDSRRPDYRPDHDPSCAQHRHGLAAELLCSLASSRDADEDHVACFATGLAEDDDDSKKASRSGGGLADVGLLSIFAPAFEMEFLSSSRGTASEAFPLSHGGACQSWARQWCLRSICLLI